MNMPENFCRVDTLLINCFVRIFSNVLDIASLLSQVIEPIYIPVSFYFIFTNDCWFWTFKPG